MNDPLINRQFGPKATDHPSVGKKCPACHQAFKAGDFTTLIILGPGAAAEVHWACATGRVRDERCRECKGTYRHKMDCSIGRIRNEAR